MFRTNNNIVTSHPTWDDTTTAGVENRDSSLYIWPSQGDRYRGKTFQSGFGCYSGLYRALREFYDNERPNRFGKAQANLSKRDCCCGECGWSEENVQPTPALHVGEGQKCCHPERLLLRPGAHRSRPPRLPLDSHPTVLLWERS